MNRPSPPAPRDDDQAGFALLMVLLFLLAVTAIIAPLVLSARTDFLVASNRLQQERLESIADGLVTVIARELASPPLVQVIPATPASGTALPRCASLAELTPASLALQAVKPADDGDGLVLRVLETSGTPVAAALRLFGTQLDLGPIAAGAIVSWRLRRRPDGWDATRCDLLER